MKYHEIIYCLFLPWLRGPFGLFGPAFCHSWGGGVCVLLGVVFDTLLFLFSIHRIVFGTLFPVPGCPCSPVSMIWGCVRVTPHPRLCGPFGICGGVPKPTKATFLCYPPTIDAKVVINPAQLTEANPNPKPWSMSLQ